MYEQLKEICERFGDHPKSFERSKMVIQAVATGIGAAQVVGLIRAPESIVDVDGIESKLLFVANAVSAKMLELDEQDRNNA